MNPYIKYTYPAYKPQYVQAAYFDAGGNIINVKTEMPILDQSFSHPPIKTSIKDIIYSC